MIVLSFGRLAGMTVPLLALCRHAPSGQSVSAPVEETKAASSIVPSWDTFPHKMHNNEHSSIINPFQNMTPFFCKNKPCGSAVSQGKLFVKGSGPQINRIL